MYYVIKCLNGFAPTSRRNLCQIKKLVPPTTLSGRTPTEPSGGNYDLTCGRLPVCQGIYTLLNELTLAAVLPDVAPRYGAVRTVAVFSITGNRPFISPSNIDCTLLRCRFYFDFSGFTVFALQSEFLKFHISFFLMVTLPFFFMRKGYALTPYYLKHPTGFNIDPVCIRLFALFPYGADSSDCNRKARHRRTFRLHRFTATVGTDYSFPLCRAFLSK